MKLKFIIIFSIMPLIINSCASMMYQKPIKIEQTTIPTINPPPKLKLVPVTWQKINNNYCVDTDNAKKLIYNIKMLKLNNNILRMDLKLVSNFNKEAKKQNKDKNNK